MPSRQDHVILISAVGLSGSEAEAVISKLLYIPTKPLPLSKDKLKEFGITITSILAFPDNSPKDITIVKE